MGATVVDPAMAIHPPVGPHSEAKVRETNSASAKSAAVAIILIQTRFEANSGCNVRDRFWLGRDFKRSIQWTRPPRI
jgi:hypothetical protein